MSKTHMGKLMWFIPWGILIFLLSSCSATRFLEEDESLLIETKIEIKPNKDIKNKSKLKLELDRMIRQKPNGNFLWIPREYIYYKNSNPGDSSWFNNFSRNYLAEEPSIFDESISKRSAQDMENYLKNKKGFFNAKVNYQVNQIPKRTQIVYEIDAQNRYKINSYQYYGKDSTAVGILNRLKDEGEIQVGDYIDATAFDLELTRMSLALQNEGYANFATNYFNIQGDSTAGNHSVDLYIELLLPRPDSMHQRYTLGDVHVFTDFTGTANVPSRKDTLYKNRRYYSRMDDFLVKPSTLDNLIFLNSGQQYTRDARSKTFRKLSSLGTYRFVTLQPNLDAVNDSIIHYDIFLTPFKNKWVADFGSDIFFSTLNQSNRQLVGFSFNSQFKNRNLLGGAEQFTISQESGLELQLNPNVLIRTVSLGLNASLEIPKQLNLFKFPSSLKSLGLLTDDRYEDFKENTTTNISGGYNFFDIFDAYSRSSFQASYTYDYRPSNNSRFLIRQFGLDFNDYELKDNFRDLIGNNPLLLRSFEDNLLTGFLFRDFTYIYNKPVTASGNSFTFIGNIEISGWETYLTNKLYNALSGSDDIWRLNESIAFAKYFRFELDPRYYKFFSKKQSIAARFVAGIILPFGGDQSAPFIKQFGVGGPNSLRAWDQKELGPGSHRLTLDNPIEGQTFYQTGDIRIEANFEYRFSILWLLEGALFVDAGNVWTLKENEERPGSQFGSDFLNEIAVAAGYGLRFDFTYFNIRFDFGYKVRNPYPFLDTGRHWFTPRQILDQGFGNFQVAVNYPF